MRIIKAVFISLMTVALLLCLNPAYAADPPAFKINGKKVPAIVANVNGTDIPYQYLENQVATYKMILMQQGQSLSAKDEEDFARTTLNRLIDQELIFQNRKKIGVEVKSDQVEQEIDKIAKQFPSQELFLSALAAQKLNLEMLNVSIEKKLVEEDFIRTKIAPNVKVEDDKVQAFYKQNKDKFSQPERYKIKHIYVSAIKENNQNPKQGPAIRKKAERLNKLIEKDARAKIEKIMGLLKKDQSFEELSEKFSEDERSKGQGGLIGTIVPQAIYPEIAEVMVKMKKNQVSEIIRTPLGFHILKLDEKLPASTIPLKKVKADILNMLLKKETEQAKAKYLATVRQKSKIKIFL